MNRDKQIEETWKEIYKLLMLEADCSLSGEDCRTIADLLIINDYRKASDIISEVIAIAKQIFCPDCDYDVADIRYNLDWLEAELKKKYESEKDDG
jgi:hypothetical protein